MTDREKAINGLECLANENAGCYTDCPYYADSPCFRKMEADVLALLREQEPRVMTLEEVIKHYSLPPVFVDDLSAQEDYLQDIAPLYA